MRRALLVVALAGLLVLAGCTDAPAGASEDFETETPRATATGNLELHHIDVGQADATLVVAPSNETMLVDSGDWRRDGQAVLEYLDAHDVDRIDHLVATHGHADHVGGHAALIEYYEEERGGVGAAYDSGVVHTTRTYENYLDAVEEHDVRLFDVQEGDTLPFGDDVTVTVLNPPEREPGSDLHYNSVTLAVEYGTVRYLATGDAESAAENRLLEQWRESLDADVYRAGHHGSSTSSTDPFLAAVSPDIAVISSGFHSPYGHPHDEVLRRFADRGIETYWTGVHGDVVVTTDGETVRVSVETDAPTDPLELLAMKPTDETDSDGRSLDAAPTDPLDQ